jgi:hypothetical protein
MPDHELEFPASPFRRGGLIHGLSSEIVTDSLQIFWQPFRVRVMGSAPIRRAAAGICRAPAPMCRASATLADLRKRKSPRHQPAAATRWPAMSRCRGQRWPAGADPLPRQVITAARSQPRQRNAGPPPDRERARGGHRAALNFQRGCRGQLAGAAGSPPGRSWQAAASARAPSTTPRSNGATAAQPSGPTPVDPAGWAAGSACRMTASRRRRAAGRRSPTAVPPSRPIPGAARRRGRTPVAAAQNRPSPPPRP